MLGAVEMVQDSHTTTLPVVVAVQVQSVDQPL
jgi:hypothetical protein